MDDEQIIEREWWDEDMLMERRWEEQEAQINNLINEILCSTK